MQRIITYKQTISGFEIQNADAAIPELIHAGEAWLPRDGKVGWHKHRAWEFYYQIEGSTLWRVRNKRHRISAGVLLGVGPGIPHALIDQPDSQHHYFYAGIDLHPLLRRIPQLRSIMGRSPYFVRHRAEVMTVPFRQLIREVSLDLLFRSESLRLAVDALVIEIARVVARTPGKSFLAVHPAAQRVRDLIDQRPEENWRTLTLARMAGISVSRLNECFRKEFSMSPHRYLLKRRLDLATRLVQENVKSISDIALELGFSSSQHFAMAFHKRFGISASEFRVQKKTWKRGRSMRSHFRR